MESEMAKCAGCKKMFPKSQLRQMWRLPLKILRLAHMTPGKEGNYLYCRSCARSQNVGAIFLAVLFSFAVVMPTGHKFLAYGVVGGWILGFLIWLVLTIRYKIQMMLFKRKMAFLSQEERERVLDRIPEPRQQKVREYLRS
jgi:hypothetical protein